MKLEKIKYWGKEDSIYKRIENECFKINSEKIISTQIIKSSSIICFIEKNETCPKEDQIVQKSS